jgi:hypothetical protein
VQSAVLFLNQMASFAAAGVTGKSLMRAALKRETRLFFTALMFTPACPARRGRTTRMTCSTGPRGISR